MGFDISSANLSRIYAAADSAKKGQDATIVPYGKGKFYLASKQSLVAAFLPNVLNRLLKLSLPPRQARAAEVVSDFRAAFLRQHGASGDRALKEVPLPKKLTVSYVKNMKGKASVDATKISRGEFPNPRPQRVVDSFAAETRSQATGKSAAV